MSVKHIVFLALFIVSIITVFSNAQALEKDGLLPIYGNACEKIKSDEPRSSTRVRVTDRACYAAAESIPEIQSFKDKLSDHDFSVLVYNIVDNYLEALSVKTLVEDEREMCVEVSGGINPENLQSAWEKAETEIKEKEEVAQMEATAHPNPQELYPNIPAPTPTQLITPRGGSEFTAFKLFFMPTHFYNDTQSNNLANVLKEFFLDKNNISVVEDRKDADYIIHSEVLRAKIDQINENSNRLQMVISLELRNQDGKSIITEHQNRFVLFSIDDNEQEVAFRLLKKLFKNAAQLLYKRIERESGLSL